jgi:hypothetical protein
VLASFGLMTLKKALKNKGLILSNTEQQVKESYLDDLDEDKTKSSE